MLHPASAIRPMPLMQEGSLFAWNCLQMVFSISKSLDDTENKNL